MTREVFDSATVEAMREVIVEPVFAVEIGMVTPLRFSTSEGFVWNNRDWPAGSVEVLGLETSAPSIQIFNENAAIGNFLWRGKATGVPVKIYRGYKYPAYTDTGNPGRVVGHTPFYLRYSGYVGSIRIKDRIFISCEQLGPRRVPWIKAKKPYFNHLPKPGDRIVTGKQDITLI